MTLPVEDRQPWHRQPKETANSYGAFRVFRDLGPKRQLAAVVTEYGVSDSTVRRWAKQHHWVDRATAWDDHVGQLEDEARLKAFREMRENHLNLAKVAVHRALLALDRVDVKHIAPGTAVRLLDFGTRLERETLAKTPEEWLGLTAEGEPVEDPWDAIATALTSG